MGEGGFAERQDGFVENPLNLYKVKIKNMTTIHPQFITDAEGKRLSVVLGIQEFENMLEELEELEDIRSYDDAKTDKDPSIPIDEAFKMIEALRQIKK